MISEFSEKTMFLRDLLQARGWKLAAAESCTGGLLAEVCTRLPGSSLWFEASCVTYSNEAKQRFLGVPAETLKQFGAVSEETARAMACGMLDRSDVPIAVSITGIAGPDGGSSEKPVGMVCFAVAWADQLVTETHHFKGNRAQIREQAVLKALDLVCQALQ